MTPGVMSTVVSTAFVGSVRSTTDMPKLSLNAPEVYPQTCPDLSCMSANIPKTPSPRAEGVADTTLTLQLNPLKPPTCAGRGTCPCKPVSCVSPAPHLALATAKLCACCGVVGAGESSLP